MSQGEVWVMDAARRGWVCLELFSSPASSSFRAHGIHIYGDSTDCDRSAVSHCGCFVLRKSDEMVDGYRRRFSRTSDSPSHGQRSWMCVLLCEDPLQQPCAPCPVVAQALPEISPTYPSRISWRFAPQHRDGRLVSLPGRRFESTAEGFLARWRPARAAPRPLCDSPERSPRQRRECGRFRDRVSDRLEPPRARSKQYGQAVEFQSCARLFHIVSRLFRIGPQWILGL